MPDETPPASTIRNLAVTGGRPTGVIDLDRPSGSRRSRQACGRSPCRADACCVDPAIHSPRLRRLPGLRLPRADDSPPSHDRSRVDHRCVSSKVEPFPRPRLGRAGLLGTAIWIGERVWSRSNPRGIGRNDSRARNRNRDGDGPKRRGRPRSKATTAAPA